MKSVYMSISVSFILHNVSSFYYSKNSIIKKVCLSEKVQFHSRNTFFGISYIKTAIACKFINVIIIYTNMILPYCSTTFYYVVKEFIFFFYLHKFSSLLLYVNQNLNLKNTHNTLH